MCHEYLLFNAVNFNFGQVLTMSVQFTITFSSFLFEYQNLVAFHVFNNTGGNFPSYKRVANGNLAFAFSQKNLIKFYLISGVSLQAVNEYLFAFFGFKLLSCNIN